tara:strand:+ start:322 stop:537 length:216 start_codon:yes stop_codon:yes gene_type:complete
MSVEIKEVREVWWASTKQYDLTVDGKEVSFRWAENSKGSDMYILTDNGWDGWDTDSEYPEVFEMMMDGELD